MANKRKGQLGVSSEWARHLRPFLKRKFWKKERYAGKQQVKKDKNEDYKSNNT